MSNKLLLFLLTVLLLRATGAAAEEEVRVIVLPFEVHAAEQLDYLSEQLPDLIEKELKGEGVAVAKPSEAPEGLPKTGKAALDRLRDLGFREGADFVIWGSVTKIGNRFSFDVSVMATSGDSHPQSVYVEGEGVESMLDSVQVLVKDVGMKIFKREKVARVEVSGNKRIESEAIKRVMKTKEGSTYLAKDLQDDIKSIYKMGYFSDVRVEAEGSAAGEVVTFKVVENDTIRNVNIKGNSKFDDKKIREVISAKPGTILNTDGLRRDIGQIEKLYKDEGYHNIKVSHETKSVSENRADVNFLVEEGKKIYVKVINFEGNIAYDDETLKDLMETKEKGFFSWFTSSGDLDAEVLDKDISKVSAYYHNNGYIEARAGEPELTYKEDEIHITIRISEGQRFKVGKVDIEGDLIKPKSELVEKIKTVTGEVFNRELIREDVLTLQDIYSDAGYAYAEISPRIDQDSEKLTAGVTYVINKGALVYFEKIIITGNTKTRDKVIRRELKVYEQELFSSSHLKRGARNLYRLDFFEDVKVNTSKGSADDKMILNVDVTEKPTGAISFGAGYSSRDHLFAMASISQRNLFGRGQLLNLRAQFGGRTTNYTLSFTEPWLFDIPLSAGFDLYDTIRDYDTYDKESFGGTLRFGYPVFDYTNAYISYNYDRADIRNITDDASSSIRDIEGTNIAHTLMGMLRRDSRDRIFNPTEGSDNSITIEHAGTPIGGDIGFTKYQANSGWYIPLFWDTVGVLHGTTGFIHGDTEGEVPVWERFYLGGMDTVRGYSWRDISPEDPETGDKIGGNKMVQFNVELMLPIIKKAGLMGVLFYDTGNAYDNGESMSLSQTALRESTGFGFRWYSPIGPMRLEYGYILDPERKGEGGWEFSMGMAF